ncbi:MAG: nodulation protein NfeD, partial [Candidatus Neomarinimicrobiota bacterium]|nr:nodulation protein NfeD [Candidatus Neomarinimicrobiota bacterium]
MKSILLFVFAVYSVIYSDVVYRIPIQGTIDLGLPPYISRELAEAEKNRALAVIFDIDTFGGRVDAATQIK